MVERPLGPRNQSSHRRLCILLSWLIYPFLCLGVEVGNFVTRLKKHRCWKRDDKTPILYVDSPQIEISAVFSALLHHCRVNAGTHRKILPTPLLIMGLSDCWRFHWPQDSKCYKWSINDAQEIVLAFSEKRQRHAINDSERLSWSSLPPTGLPH